MSEAIRVPFADSSAECCPAGSEEQTYVTPLRTEIQGMPTGLIEKNATGLDFDTTTPEEFIDYIGQTAKYLGVGLELVCSERGEICFQFASSEEEDKFLDLLTDREEEAQRHLARKYNSSNPCEATLFMFDEVLEQTMYGVRKTGAENYTYEGYGFRSNQLTLRLESEINENQRSIWGGGEFADKRNLYYFAGYLINKLQEGR